ncbi:hypothetical protein K2O51_31305 (plasmid) [Cupriavidus pinatubonensis]|uniref:hypothetical protein n=1 Tax=Cupriavidus pinatubonensis TaxID=248026 RepID=UPI001C72E11A|nr:hypothetical protein [Cupriavidus pinatubonensis]QYY33732.1 hypothetical protein K2O51_31305 [Cupriavidus pinatubonensis]
MTIELERLTDAVLKGARGIGIDRFLVPSATQKVVSAVTQGDAGEITAILLEVAGDAISFAAGRSPGGAPAVKALAEAMGPSLARIRESAHPSGGTAAPILVTWRAALIDWSVTGIAAGDTPDSDLSLIGQLIGSPKGRDHAAAVFLGAIAVCQHVLRDA